VTPPDSKLLGPVSTQNLFRAVNLEIRHLTRRWENDATRFEAVCECDDATCALSISVDRALFDGAAGQPGHYVVAAAHRPRDGERIVQRDSEAVVVERLLQPAPS
jgi:hypothetical protein